MFVNGRQPLEPLPGKKDAIMRLQLTRCDLFPVGTVRGPGHAKDGNRSSSIGRQDE